MVEKNMVESPYGDFVKLIKTAGRVEAALAVLRTETGNYVKCPEMIAILDGEEEVIHTNVTGRIDE